MKYKYKRQDLSYLTTEELSKALENIEYLFNTIDMSLGLCEILNKFYLDLSIEFEKRRKKIVSNLIKNSIYYV